MINVDPEPTRQLQVLRSGMLHFGIFANSIKSTAEWRAPAKLPHAPAAVLGVVGVRGHVLTVLDPVALLGETDEPDYSSGSLIVLRGDEQLGLAVNEVEEVISVAPGDLKPTTQVAHRLVFGFLTRHGNAVSVLNEQELFATAMQGRERRRRRF